VYELADGGTTARRRAAREHAIPARDHGEGAERGAPARDQCDSDSLPPYDELDPVLEAYVEHDRSPR
jgi:hypothetical protein